MSELSAIVRIKKVLQTAKTLHCGADELDYEDVVELVGLIESLEEDANLLKAQLADAQAKLATYEEGYDPVTNPPEDNRTVLIVVDSLENEPSMYLANYDGSWFHSVGYSIKAERVARWYSVMGAKEEE